MGPYFKKAGFMILSAPRHKESVAMSKQWSKINWRQQEQSSCKTVLLKPRIQFLQVRLKQIKSQTTKYEI